MYYYYNQTMTGFEAVSPDFRHPCLFDARDIPLENAVLLDGLVYDNRELNYWKTSKKIELDSYIDGVLANGYETNGIKVSTTELSLNKLSQMARLNDENQDKSVGLTMYDYYNHPQPVTRETFKKIIKAVGNYMTACESKYRDGINALARAKTISEVQAIIV
jgi:hypothetical protein